MLPRDYKMDNRRLTAKNKLNNQFLLTQDNPVAVARYAAAVARTASGVAPAPVPRKIALR